MKELEKRSKNAPLDFFLDSLEERRTQTNVRDYGNVSTIVSEKLKEKEDELPTIDEIIASVGNDPEALKELKKLAQRTMAKREAVKKNSSHVKKIGGN